MGRPAKGRVCSLLSFSSMEGLQCCPTPHPGQPYGPSRCEACPHVIRVNIVLSHAITLQQGVEENKQISSRRLRRADNHYIKLFSETSLELYASVAKRGDPT
jgi:hypothetical protein